MALKGGKRFLIRDFKGLNSFASKENLTPDWFYQSDNILITNDGSAGVLRSPAVFNDVLAITPGNTVISAFDYAKASGHLILFDLNTVAGTDTIATYITTGTTNTLIRSLQGADKVWKRLTINDWCFGLNGVEYVQTDGTTTFYKVGITPPTVAPAVSFSSTGTGSIDVGVSVSYAYRNSVTGHVSAPSDAVSILSTGSSSGLDVSVTASTQIGVDGIVFFVTEDGGSIPYLYVDANGDPIVAANTTGSNVFSIDTLDQLDTLTPEPLYNLMPPQDAFYMFRWRDRICLMDFRTDTTKQSYVQYSGLESTYIGVAQESYPPLNLLMVAAKGDKTRSGVETPVGGLVIGEADSYLIRGELSDKTAGPDNPEAITESVQPLNWSIGTRSPYSVASTPFGVIWLDQNKRIQLWNYAGFPVEMGLPIRSDLIDILDTSSERNRVVGTWFQHGKTGGHYAIVGYTTDTLSASKMFIVTLYRDPESGELKSACAVSSIGGNCIITAIVAGRGRCFIGGSGALREVLDLAIEGAGWLPEQTRFFKLVLGNDSEFCYWHSIRLDMEDICGLVIKVSNIDGTEEQRVTLEQETGAGSAWFGMLDCYGFRKILYFNWNAQDDTERIVLNLRVAYSPTGRLL